MATGNTEKFRTLNIPEQGGSSGYYRAFNLDEDPKESVNLMAKLPEKAKEMKQLFDSFNAGGK